MISFPNISIFLTTLTSKLTQAQTDILKLSLFSANQSTFYPKSPRGEAASRMKSNFPLCDENPAVGFSVTGSPLTIRHGDMPPLKGTD